MCDEGRHHDCGHVHSEFAQPLDAGIWRAAQLGNLARLQELIGKCGKVNPADETGYTPLHYAARAGHLTIVSYLLNSNANV